MPFFAILSKWLEQGELVDPYSEFFVRDRRREGTSIGGGVGAIGGGTMWSPGYLNKHAIYNSGNLDNS